MWTNLLHAIRNDGLEAHICDVRALLRLARGRRVTPLLCEVAGDASAPEPVRTLALELIVRDLSD